jgi:hypothetical protein
MHFPGQFASVVQVKPALSPALHAFPQLASVVQAFPSLRPRKQVLPHDGGAPAPQAPVVGLQVSEPLQKTLSLQNCWGSGTLLHVLKMQLSAVQNSPSLQ